ncbi:MAG: 2-hydroxyacid dehydrogenase [Rheinheimera sp.]
MSIALVIPDRKLDQLQQKLQQQLPGVAIEIWPEVKEPTAVTMAVLWRHPPGCLDAMTQLKALQSFGAGVDNILIDKSLPNLPLARIVDPMLTQSMLQYLQGVVQHYQLRLDEFSLQQRQRVWKARSPRKIQHICVLGLGELGQAAARHFAGLGFAVSGWSASQKNLAEVQCFAGEAEFGQAVSNADLVICLLPLTAHTENLLNQQRLAQLKMGAILVNVARGAIVDDLALLQNLDSGHISAACLDVFRVEPLPPEHPFWQHPAILLTPHISAVTNADTAVTQIAENYRRSLAGLPLLNLVCQQRGY